MLRFLDKFELSSPEISRKPSDANIFQISTPEKYVYPDEFIQPEPLLHEAPVVFELHTVDVEGFDEI
jgi:hypothetical protein